MANVYQTSQDDNCVLCGLRGDMSVNLHTPTAICAIPFVTEDGGNFTFTSQKPVLWLGQLLTTFAVGGQAAEAFMLHYDLVRERWVLGLNNLVSGSVA